MTSIIKATNIKRTFTEGEVVTHVLKGIDVSVEQGEFVAIMGKSGAGKSTLMYQLSVLDEPSEGEIIVDGVNIIELDEAGRTAFRLNTLGYVFQNYALVPDLSAEENVMIPLLMRGVGWEEARKTAQAAIDGVGLMGKYKNLPQHYLVANNNASPLPAPSLANRRFSLLMNPLPILIVFQADLSST